MAPGIRLTVGFEYGPTAAPRRLSDNVDVHKQLATGLLETHQIGEVESPNIRSELQGVLAPNAVPVIFSSPPPIEEQFFEFDPSAPPRLVCRRNFALSSAAPLD